MKTKMGLLLLSALSLFVSLSFIQGDRSDSSSVTQQAAEHDPIDRASRDTRLVEPVTTTTTTIPSTTITVIPTTSTTMVKKISKPEPIVRPRVTTTTTTTTPVVKAQLNSDSRRWMPLIRQYPWDAEHAYKIMMCESGGNPSAINKSSGATGLFQIFPGGSKYLDPATNVATAYAKYKASGWRPWVCRV